MKALIQTGHRYDQDMAGFTNALAEVGVECMLWSESKVSAFAAFDECKPDMFVSSTGLMTRALTKCFDKYKPKVALFVDEPCEFEVKPDVVMSYGVIDADKYNDSKKLAVYPCVNMNVVTNPKEDPSLKCEVLYVGGYNTAVRPLINKYVVPLAQDFKLRIYGPGNWIVPNALGTIYYGNVKNAMLNADSFIYLSNSDDDLSWNPFVAMSVGTPVFTNNKKILELFNSAEKDLDFAFEIGKSDISEVIRTCRDSKLEMFMKGRFFVYENYTNYHYADFILKHLGYDYTTKLLDSLRKRVNNE